MKMKPNFFKVGGFLLALAAVAALYVAFVARTPTGSEDLTAAITQELVSANNIGMELISAHTEGSGYRVEVCYNLPDQRDWLLTYPTESQTTTLSVADIKASPHEEGTMYWSYDRDGKIAKRCQYLFFALHIPSQKENLTLQISRLYAREVGQSDYCLEASQKMVERNFPVTIDCLKVNGFDGLVYVKFPVELFSMDPVFQSIFKDIKWDTYTGSWSFTFPVNPP